MPFLSLATMKAPKLLDTRLLLHAQDFNIMMLKTLFTCGTYVHWRNFMTIWDKINGKRERQGLLLERVPPETFGVPGCRSSWWISLDPAELAGAPPPTASCVLLYVHGEYQQLTGHLCSCRCACRPRQGSAPAL